MGRSGGRKDGQREYFRSDFPPNFCICSLFLRDICFELESKICSLVHFYIFVSSVVFNKYFIYMPYGICYIIMLYVYTYIQLMWEEDLYVFSDNMSHLQVLILLRGKEMTKIQRILCFLNKSYKIGHNVWKQLVKYMKNISMMNCEKIKFDLC